MLKKIGSLFLLMFPIFAMAQIVPIGMFKNKVSGDVEILDFGTFRAFADGTYARSCKEYRNPTKAKYKYQGATGDGVYRIDPDGYASGSLAAYDVTCLMSYGDGGWTLVATGRYNQASSATATTFAIGSGKYLANTQYTPLRSISTEVLFGNEYNIVKFKQSLAWAASSNCHNMSTAAPAGSPNKLWSWNEGGCDQSGSDYTYFLNVSWGFGVYVRSGVRGFQYNNNGDGVTWTNMTADYAFGVPNVNVAVYVR